MVIQSNFILTNLPLVDIISGYAIKQGNTLSLKLHIITWLNQILLNQIPVFSPDQITYDLCLSQLQLTRTLKITLK